MKEDRCDARSLADAPAPGRPRLESPPKEGAILAELRLLTCDEAVLIEQRTALINQLQSALHDFYPTALAACSDWTRPGA